MDDILEVVANLLLVIHNIDMVIGTIYKYLI